MKTIFAVTLLAATLVSAIDLDLATMKRGTNTRRVSTDEEKRGTNTRRESTRGSRSGKTPAAASTTVVDHNAVPGAATNTPVVDDSQSNNANGMQIHPSSTNGNNASSGQ